MTSLNDEVFEQCKAMKPCFQEEWAGDSPLKMSGSQVQWASGKIRANDPRESTTLVLRSIALLTCPA